jgi:acetyl esterase/lipase
MPEYMRSTIGGTTMIKRIKGFKRWQKVLCFILSVIVAVTVFFNIWAAVRGQSASSLLVENVMRLIPLGDRKDPEYFKQALENSSKAYELPDNARNKLGFTELDGFADTYMVNHQDDTRDLVIFYLHGGGYWTQPQSLHYTFFDKMAREFKAQLVLPIYPKAPSYTAVDAHKMVKDCYLYLINSKGVSSGNIVIMGDSAGGGLALSLLQVLRDENIPMPRQAVLFSPWLDATNSSPGMREVNDPFRNVDNLAYGGEIYAGGLETTDPLVSPIYGDITGIPPIDVFSGTYDALNIDVEKMAAMAEEKNIDFTLYSYEKMIHGFIGFTFLPEAKAAFEVLREVVLGFELK